MSAVFTAPQRFSVSLVGATILALVMSLLVAVSPAHAATISEVEPNAATATAQPLANGSTVSASFRTTGDCDNGFYDCDVYKVYTSKAGRLVLDLRFSSSLGTDSSFALSVTDTSGAVMYRHDVSSADYSGSKLRALAMYVGQGTFYVSLKARVSGFGSGYIWSGQPYTMKATVSSGVVETERNGTTATADTIKLATRIYGSSFSGDCNNNFYDCDYFRVSLPTASTLLVDFRFSCALGTDTAYEFGIYDNAGALVKRSILSGGACEGDTLRSVPVAMPAGNAYFRVYSRAGGITKGQRYSLMVSGVLKTAAPTIAGTAKVGATLTARPGTWGPAPVGFTYQWRANGTALSGATASTYKLTSASVGKKITVSVTARKTGFTTVTRTSASTAAVAR